MGSIADLLAGAGTPPGAPGPGPMPGPGGPPVGPPGAGIPGAPDSPDVKASIDHARVLLERALSEEKDEEDKAKIIKAIQAVQDIFATRAKNMDAAMGITPQLKAVRQAQRG